MDLLKSIDIATTYLGKEIFNPLTINYQKDDDKSLLLVERRGSSVIIRYGQLVSLFRGLTLIKEKINELNYSYSFNRSFDNDGIMLDCSRNGVMKNEKVKEMILFQALMGNNRLLLYTEDTYKLDKYPYFGYLRGAYSKEDLKEFVEYGESFGVELIPCIQTLAHLYHALKWEPMASLREGNDCLLPDNEDTYKFIEEMIKTSRECYKCKEIHIGMDESFELGLHKYLELHGYQDRVEVFSRHLRRVIDICKKYDFSPMIWSDMYFRLNSKDQEYYRKEPLPKSTIDLIPPEVKLVYWDYYHTTEEEYLEMIKFHKDAPNPLTFAGGTWRWKGYVPAIETSVELTEQALKACLKENVKEAIITAWGDDGNECPFFTFLPSLAQLSLADYNSSFSKEDINSLLVAIFNLSLEDFYKLDLLDQPAKKRLSVGYNPSKYFLYQDVLLGVFDDQVKDDFANNYKEYAKILNEMVEKAGPFSYMFKMMSTLSQVLSIKVDLGVKIRKAYKANDKDILKNYIKDIDTCLLYLDEFHKDVKYRWMYESRPFGYEVVDGRLGFLKNRIITAKERILEYLDGKIEKIEELEVEILPYDGKDYEVQWNSWIRNVSTCN